LSSAFQITLDLEVLVSVEDGVGERFIEHGERAAEAGKKRCMKI
jgi:hypothetical protein